VARRPAGLAIASASRHPADRHSRRSGWFISADQPSAAGALLLVAARARQPGRGLRLALANCASRAPTPIVMLSLGWLTVLRRRR
jgi:hypothetical protein